MEHLRGDHMNWNEYFPFIFLTIAGLTWALVVPLFLIFLDIVKKKRGR